MTTFSYLTNPAPDTRFLNGYFEGFSKLLYYSPKLTTDEYSFGIYF